MPVQIYERDSDAGGVWSTSQWPGAGVDVPIHWYQLYSDLKPGQHKFLDRMRRDRLTRTKLLTADFFPRPSGHRLANRVRQAVRRVRLLARTHRQAQSAYQPSPITLHNYLS